MRTMKAQLEANIKILEGNELRQQIKAIEMLDDLSAPNGSTRRLILIIKLLTVSEAILLGVPATVIVYPDEIKNALRKARKRNMVFALSAIGIVLALFFSCIGALFRFL